MSISTAPHCTMHIQWQREGLLIPSAISAGRQCCFLFLLLVRRVTAGLMDLAFVALTQVEHTSTSLLAILVQFLWCSNDNLAADAAEPGAPEEKMPAIGADQPPAGEEGLSLIFLPSESMLFCLFKQRKPSSIPPSWSRCIGAVKSSSLSLISKERCRCSRKQQVKAIWMRCEHWTQLLSWENLALPSTFLVA